MFNKTESATKMSEKKSTFHQKNNFNTLSYYEVTMKKLVALAFCGLLAFSALGEDGKTTFGRTTQQRYVDFFSKENKAWCLATIKTKPKKYGVVYGKDNIPGKMWFESQLEISGGLAWASKPIDIPRTIDQLIFSYCAKKGTRFTVDLWWDNNPKRQLRPVRKVKGDDKWHEVKIPIRGKKIRFTINIKRDSDVKPAAGYMEILLKPLKEVVAANIPAVDFPALLAPVVIPEPKKMDRLGKKLFLVKNNLPEFAICLNLSEMKLKQIIVKEIENELGIPQNSIPVAENMEKIKDSKVALLLCLGKESPIPVPDKKEAYAISFDMNSPQKRIVLAAKDKAGLYWAWMSLRQLLAKKKKDVSVLACDIKDWPDYPYRGFSSYNPSELALHMRYKANFNQTPGWLTPKIWRQPPDDYKKNIVDMAVYAVERGTQINQVVDPFNDANSITISDDADLDKLMRTYDLSLSNGSRGVVLSINDGARGKESFTAADRKAYNGDKLLSHAWFVKKMEQKIKAEYPDAVIGVVTVDYMGVKGIKGYYDRVGISKDMLIYWTGPATVTFDYPADIIEKYTQGIEGRKFIIFDNTPGQAHGMYRRLTMSEKFGAGYESLYKSGQCVGMFMMSSFSNPMRNIAAMSAAEYMWNASRYDAERARQRAIAKVAGSSAAVRPVLKYSSEYLTIAYKYPVDKRLPGTKRKSFSVKDGLRQSLGWNELKERELSRYSIDDTEYNRLQGKIKHLEKILKEISKASRNALLTAEFSIFQKNLTEVIDYLYKNSKPLPRISDRSESDRTFDFRTWISE